jgi:hypothetical protein
VSFEVVEWFISQGADIDYLSVASYDSAFTIAVRNHINISAEVFELLVANCTLTYNHLFPLPPAIGVDWCQVTARPFKQFYTKERVKYIQILPKMFKRADGKMKKVLLEAVPKKWRWIVLESLSVYELMQGAMIVLLLRHI